MQNLSDYSNYVLVAYLFSFVSLAIFMVVTILKYRKAKHGKI